MDETLFLTRRVIRPEEFLLLRPAPSCGALSTFFGFVRDHHEGRSVTALYYECYPSMADRQIQRIQEELEGRLGPGSLRILHRVGHLDVGEVALAVAASSPHRAEAASVCMEAVERIKREVPIWKKEFFADGTSEWVRCHMAVS